MDADERTLLNAAPTRYPNAGVTRSDRNMALHTATRLMASRSTHVPSRQPPPPIANAQTASGFGSTTPAGPLLARARQAVSLGEVKERVRLWHMCGQTLRPGGDA